MIKQSQTDEEVLIIGVDMKISHPKFNRQAAENDIGLLKLKDSIDFTKYIYPICLPTKQPNNSKAVATGFGKTEFDELSDHLLKVNLDFFSHNESLSVFQNQVKINSSIMLCYGHRTEMKDTCRVI